MSPLQARVLELEAQLEELMTQLETEKEQRARAAADLQNFQRRQTEDKAAWSELAVVGFLRSFLPALLELSLGAEHTTDEGVKKVIEKFMTTAAGLGITKIAPEPGTPVDPNLHEVLMVAEGEPGAVVQLLEPGWQYGERVLVAAKVSAAASD